MQTIARTASVTGASVGRPSDERRGKSGQKTSATPQAYTCVRHVLAYNRSNTVPDLANQQQVPSVLAVQHGVGHIVESTSRAEKSSQRQRVTFSPSVVPQALYVSAVNSNFHHATLIRNGTLMLSTSAMSGYPKYSIALNLSSKRLRVNARVSNHPAHNVIMDTATDVPCISVNFVQTHPTKKDTENFVVPAGATNLRSADGSPLKSLGYFRFELTLGVITLPVEALELLSLGPDMTLLDNSIMNVFSGVLDWSTEQESFKTS